MINFASLIFVAFYHNISDRQFRSQVSGMELKQNNMHLSWCRFIIFVVIDIFQIIILTSYYFNVLSF